VTEMLQGRAMLPRAGARRPSAAQVRLGGRKLISNAHFAPQLAQTSAPLPPEVQSVVHVLRERGRLTDPEGLEGA